METIQNLDSELRNHCQDNFNIVAWCGVGTTETKHSAMIADLLNPKGAHGCREIPLKLFLDEIGIPSSGYLFDTEVTTEEWIDNGCRRLDILLKNKDFVVIIENKTETSDHFNQLKDYADWLNQKCSNVKEKRLVYLTYDGFKPKYYNSNGSLLRCLSYKCFVVEWLNNIKASCKQEETKIALSHYSDFIRILLNCNVDKIRKEIAEWVNTHLKDAKNIINHYREMRYGIDTVEMIYENLCVIYCKNLLRPLLGAETSKISVSDFSFDKYSSAPFCCTYHFNNKEKIEFIPLAHNKKSYGKLYAFEDNILKFGNVSDKQWDCNFFDWLNGDEEEIKEMPFFNKLSLKEYFSEL